MKRMSLIPSAIAVLLALPAAAFADPAAATLEQMFPHGQANDFGWASAPVSSAAGVPASIAADAKPVDGRFAMGQSDAFGAARASLPAARIEYFTAGGYTRVVSTVPTVGSAPVAGAAAGQLYAPGIGYSPMTPDPYHLRPANFTSQVGG